MKAHKNEGKMNNDSRIAVLETTIIHIHETLERIDKRFDSIDRRFDKIDQRFDKIDLRFDKVEENFKHDISRLDNKIDNGFRDVNNRLWFNFFWVVAGFAGTLSLIARLFHWI